jgi:long-chain acyl-CoA synthetase
VEEVIFVTGASGALGRRIVREILRRGNGRLIVLARAAPGRTATAVVDNVLGPGQDEAVIGRVRVVSGDVTRPDLGMESAEARGLQKTVTTVVHAAAITRFDQPLAVCRQVNVAGTAVVLAWARSCRRLARFAFLSTPYVAGRREGLILESEREHNAGFVNAYEQSKYEAEAMVEEAWNELPIVVYRTSTILGDARDGRVDRYAAPHFAFRLLWMGLAPMFPGSLEFPVDLVPGDYAGGIVASLLLDAFQPRTRFHIATGADRSVPLGRVIDLAFDTFTSLDAAWSRRGYVQPVAVDSATYEMFRQTVERTGNPLYRKVLGQLDSFSEQLVWPKEFDTSNVVAAIPDYVSAMPRFEDYFPKVLGFCIRHDWKPG